MDAYPVKSLLYFCNVSLKGSSDMPRQTVHYFDLTFVLRGRLLYYANGERFDMRKGDALLLPPGTIRARVGIEEEVTYTSFNFTLNEGFSLPDKIFLPNVITGEIRTLLSAFSQSHISPLYHSEQKAVNLLNYIIFEILDSVSFETNDKNVVKMIKYIDSNITSRITLSDVSGHANLSREYAAYIFKRELGRTVIEYINERKMFIAKNMIQSGNMSLSEIAQTLGYENYGYFSRCFKKHFNTSPKTFMKMGNI